MKIKDGWKIEDGVSGLKITAVKGKKLDKLHIEGKIACGNRDFWFTKDGKFDGTGSVVKN